MKAIRFKHQTGVFNEKSYEPIPVLQIKSDQGEIISCWKLSFRERIKILFVGKMWMSIMSFNKPVVPSIMSVDRKKLYSHPNDRGRKL